MDEEKTTQSSFKLYELPSQLNAFGKRPRPKEWDRPAVPDTKRPRLKFLRSVPEQIEELRSVPEQIEQLGQRISKVNSHLEEIVDQRSKNATKNDLNGLT